MCPSWGCTGFCSPLDALPPGMFQTNTWQTHATGLNTPELISNGRTVTAIVCITPGNDGSIFQNRSKGTLSGLNLLHAPELISNGRTVTAIVCITPGNDRSIFQNRSKGTLSGLNLLHAPELISNGRTVTAIVCITPGNDRSIFQNRSKGTLSGLNLLHARADLKRPNCHRHSVHYPR